MSKVRTVKHHRPNRSNRAVSTEAERAYTATQFGVSSVLRLNSQPVEPVRERGLTESIDEQMEQPVVVEQPVHTPRPVSIGRPKYRALREQVRTRFVMLWTEAGKPSVIKHIVEQVGRELNVPTDDGKYSRVYEWTRDLRPHHNRTTRLHPVDESAGPLWRIKISEVVMIVQARSIKEIADDPFAHVINVLTGGELEEVTKA